MINDTGNVAPPTTTQQVRLMSKLDAGYKKNVVIHSIVQSIVKQEAKLSLG